MFDDHDRGAGLELDAPQERAETLGLRLRDATRRLVEQQQARFVGEHTGEVDDAAQTGRQLLHELVAIGAEV